MSLATPEQKAGMNACASELKAKLAWAFSHERSQVSPKAMFCCVTGAFGAFHAMKSTDRKKKGKIYNNRLRVSSTKNTNHQGGLTPPLHLYVNRAMLNNVNTEIPLHCYSNSNKKPSPSKSQLKAIAVRGESDEMFEVR